MLRRTAGALPRLAPPPPYINGPATAKMDFMDNFQRSGKT